MKDESDVQEVAAEIARKAIDKVVRKMRRPGSPPGPRSPGYVCTPEHECDNYTCRGTDECPGHFDCRIKHV